MSLTIVALALTIHGAILYLVETHLRIAPTIKILIRIVIVAVAMLWLLQIVGPALSRAPQ